MKYTLTLLMTVFALSLFSQISPIYLDTVFIVDDRVKPVDQESLLYNDDNSLIAASYYGIEPDISTTLISLRVSEKFGGCDILINDVKVNILSISTYRTRMFHVPKDVKLLSLVKSIYEDDDGAASYVKSKLIDFRFFPDSEVSYMRFEKIPGTTLVNADAPQFLRVTDYGENTTLIGYRALGIYHEIESTSTDFEHIGYLFNR
jgi:hypothetical protein